MPEDKPARHRNCMDPADARQRKTPEGRLGRYDLLQRIGRGGMAELFLARDRQVDGLERVVAIKVVLPQLADDPAFAEMFLREARFSLNLDHPNIAQVFDVGKVEDRYYIAMEYVHGHTVREILRRADSDGVRLPLGDAVGIAAHVCAAVHSAHQCVDGSGERLEIVHRDISPSNVVVRHDGVVKVLDFGIAKAARQPSVTQSGTIKGKRGYMSPEQCNGLAVDRRSDVFALGILVYELATGFRVFPGANDFAVMNRIVAGDYVPPTDARQDFPPRLAVIVEKALRTEVDERYESAQALQRDLEDFARSERLDTSTLATARYLRETFGETPYPSVDDWAMTTGVTETEVTPPRTTTERRSVVPWALGLVVVGTAGVVAWQLRAPTEAISAAAEDAKTPAVAPERTPDAPTAQPPPDPPPPTEATAPSPDVAPPTKAAEQTPKPESTKTKSRPGKRKPKRRPPKGPGTSMLP